MKFRILISLGWALGTPLLWAQGATAVSTPSSRQVVVASTARLTGTAALPASSEVVALDPFNPPPSHLRSESEVDVAAKTSNLSDEQLVVALAAQIQPSGSMMLGGEPYLLFTERRQKIGDKVSVTFDKVEYTVEIVSIANNRFRIRYNEKEAERTIK